MTNEQMLLNAAKAMGFTTKVVDGVVYVLHWSTPKNDWHSWNPIESSADCAEMEDALDIVHHRYGSPVVHIRAYSMDLLASNLLAFSDFETKGAARRYASTMVAAKIGEKL